MDESTHVPGIRCNTCREVKPLAEFTRASRGPKQRGRQVYYRKMCRDCSSDYQREFTRERREFLTAYKLERGCLDCGYDEHFAALDFDHRPGEVKLFKPNMLKSMGTWQQMLDEIAKCDVVCSNCHRIRTFNRPPANRGYDLNRGEVLQLTRRDPDPGQPPLFDAS